ncbi:MAG: ATP12 family protein [Pseudomonadota bacterium]
MRDILEDAEGAAARGDIGPGKANRGQDVQKFPKRFYKVVSVAESDGIFSVQLDNKPVKTPGRNVLGLPTRAAADCVAAEWDAVVEQINPVHMPMTRLVNTALDGVAAEMQAVMEDIIRYASTDLLCYRADGPEGLVTAQRQHWDPILDWAETNKGARFNLAEGVMHVEQPRESIAAYGLALKRHEDPIRLACIHTFTSLSGSALIALALADRFVDAKAAWAAAHVDEDWNISQWGEDDEAKSRRSQRWCEFDAAYKLLLSVGA